MSEALVEAALLYVHGNVSNERIIVLWNVESRHLCYRGAQV